MKKILMLLVFPILMSGCLEYSDGERVGQLVKFSKKGFFSKSWEGEMVLGGLKKKTDVEGRTTSVANVFEFTVEDNSIVENLKDKVGEVIKVRYREEWIHAPWRSDTSYFITSVDILK